MNEQPKNPLERIPEEIATEAKQWDERDRMHQREAERDQEPKIESAEKSPEHIIRRALNEIQITGEHIDKIGQRLGMAEKPISKSEEQTKKIIEANKNLQSIRDVLYDLAKDLNVLR